MKKLFDGTEVPARCYYYVLDWKDYNMTRFIKMTKNDSVGTLSTRDFWDLFKIAVEEDLKRNSL